MAITRLNSLSIPAGTVEPADISNNAITTDKIADTAVTDSKLHTTLDLSSKTLSGDVTFTNNVAASYFTGDGSALTGIEALPSSIYSDPSATANTLYISSTGNVGIGVTNPTNGKLCVDGSINITTTSGTYVAGALGYTDSNWGFLHRPPRVGSVGAHGFVSYAGSHLLIVEDGGNVGIGTSSPSGIIHTKSNDLGVVLQTSSTVNKRMQIFFWDSAGATTARIGNDISGANTSSLEFISGTGTTPQMVLDSAGHIRIGRSSSNNLRFEVEGQAGYSVVGGFYSPSTQSTIDFQDSNTTANYKVRIGSETDDLLLFAGGTGHVRLDSNGKFRLGTPLYNITSKLTIRDDSVTEYGDAVDNSGNEWNNGTHSQIIIGAGNNSAMLGVDADINARTYWIQGGHGAQGYAQFLSKFHINPHGGDVLINAEDATIARVGIGGVTSGSNLSGTASILDITNSNLATLMLRNTNASGNTWEIASINTGNLSFYKGTTEYMRLSNNGALSVGNTSPSSTVRLKVQGTATNTETAVEFYKIGTTANYNASIMKLWANNSYGDSTVTEIKLDAMNGFYQYNADDPGNLTDGSYRCYSNAAWGGDSYIVVQPSGGGEMRGINGGSGNWYVQGTLSKGSGSFRIPHPLIEKRGTHRLVHSFAESPGADLFYSGMVTLVDGTATINIDTEAGMTEGTFVALCREVRRHCTNESGFTAVKSSIVGNILTVEAQDPTCTDEVFWMVVGERQDPTIYESTMTDDDGKVIVEPLIAAEA